ncbi:MAG: hypothetical protein CMLOHMNK_01248 [Steroidobacteraceae bacterium]|nr:hypothetical protein [Steroidobacteraceae bacterium]
MKTTRPSGAEGFVSLSLVAANEPTMRETARKERTLEPAAKRGWDPYDVWRTRVKTPREGDTPAP